MSHVCHGDAFDEPSGCSCCFARDFRRIQLNMLFSLGYNCLGIPIAAGALYPATGARLPPELAALAMALSSVSVVVSSLMLRRYRPAEIALDEPAASPLHRARAEPDESHVSLIVN